MHRGYSNILPLPLALLCLWGALSQAAQAQTDTSALRSLEGHEVNARQLESAVASRTLTWLTGTPADNAYVSVGRMANFFGFVALRVSSDQSLTRAHVARDTIAVLTPHQVAQLAALVAGQEAAHAGAHSARLAMNSALDRLRAGEEVTQAEFAALGRNFGAAEAELGRVLAQSFGDIAGTLTPDQRASLAVIRAAHVSGAPEGVKRADRPHRLPAVDRKELNNLAARFLSWTTGTPALNDFEVVGKPSQHFGFVSLRLASGHAVRRGAVARDVTALLTPEQRQILRRAVTQNVDSFPIFIDRRAALMRVFETALDGAQIAPDTAALLGAEIGGVEASMTWAQARAMLDLRDTLTQTQRETLLEMRAAYTAAPAATPQTVWELGRQLYAQCALCHANGRVAPTLTGVVGRQIAVAPGFDRYSPAMRRFAGENGVWTDALLHEFLTSPRRTVPGTTMGFDGLGDAEDRAAILAYLATLN